jgi:hypothetical protein
MIYDFVRKTEENDSAFQDLRQTLADLTVAIKTAAEEQDRYRGLGEQLSRMAASCAAPGPDLSAGLCKGGILEPINLDAFRGMAERYDIPSFDRGGFYTGPPLDLEFPEPGPDLIAIRPPRWRPHWRPSRRH